MTDSRILEYVDERLALGRAHATIVYELRVLKYAFRLVKVPTPGFPTIVPNNIRTEWFSEEEFHALVDRLPAPLKPVMTAAYLMGWRAQSELLPLQWKHVDLKAGLITLPVGFTKNGDGREYPIGQFPELLALFQARWEATQQLQRTRGVVIPWVFYRVTSTAVCPIKSYKTAWVNARNKAGLAGRRVHDFRRCSARSLRQAGVPESVCMSLLGHKTPSMFRRYSIVDNRDLRVGVAHWRHFMPNK